MSEDQIKRAYSALYPDLEKWGAYVDAKIKELIRSYKYGEIQILPKYRVKEEQSFANKALYRKSYTDPMHEIEDKIGTRIVALVTDVVDKIAKDLQLCSAWNIKESKSKHEIFEVDPDKFGYQSIHYIVTPKDNCCTFACEDRSLLTCEIQVRTLLQHAYAEISHDNVYKGPFNKDPIILRQLAKSMALMEVADDYFCKTLRQVSNPQNEEAMLLNYLIDKFKAIKGLQQTPNFDKNLAEDILSLSEKDLVSIGEIDTFLESNPDIIEAIKHGESIICQQPIIILLAYYIVNKPYTLEKWDISADTHKALRRSLGYSSDF